MQTPDKARTRAHYEALAAEASVPAWTYQAPQRPADYPRQCYYRADKYNLIAPHTSAQPKSTLQLFRWADQREPGASLRVEVPFGSMSVELCVPSLQALRDALNDALADIAQWEADRARRESLEDIEEQLRDPDFDANLVTFVHPDVIYVEPGQLSAAALEHPGKLIIARQAEVPA
jgi:hypothetical protein